jgi:hypothetical protein
MAGRQATFGSKRYGKSYPAGAERATIEKTQDRPGARGLLRHFAAADAKIFAEALSRRDESLANVKRRQEAAMAKK